MSLCVFSTEEDNLHHADGSVVEAVIAPITAIEEGSYISYAFCEEHLHVGLLPPGRYNVILHVLDDKGSDISEREVAELGPF